MTQIDTNTNATSKQGKFTKPVKNVVPERCYIILLQHFWKVSTKNKVDRPGVLRDTARASNPTQNPDFDPKICCSWVSDFGVRSPSVGPVLTPLGIYSANFRFRVKGSHKQIHVEGIWALPVKREGEAIAIWAMPKCLRVNLKGASLSC